MRARLGGEAGENLPEGAHQAALVREHTCCRIDSSDSCLSAYLPRKGMEGQGRSWKGIDDPGRSWQGRAQVAVRERDGRLLALPAEQRGELAWKVVEGGGR